MINANSTIRATSCNGRSYRRAPALAVAALAVAGYASWAHTAEAIPIQFDIDGRWQADPSRPMQCSRTGEQVGCTMVNESFSHSLNGWYTGPTSLHLTVTRRNRANGCVTYMDAYISMTSNDAFTLTWVARDNNCDLRAGQTGTDPTYYRIS
jgi:hypothetical protein